MKQRAETIAKSTLIVILIILVVGIFLDSV